jgi:hypothetical protein
MEEKLISFETAKLAQEKGFNYPCSVVFDLQNNNEVIDFREQEAIKFIEDCETGFRTKALNYFKENYNRKDDSQDFGYFITRPTQSLLQKWLREVHNIHIKLHSSNTDIFSFEIYFMIYRNVDLNKKNLQNHKYSKINYSTYEEALEIGLQEALKLIK